MDASAAIRRAPTHIDGFDEILGLPGGRATVVAGGTGSGKAMQVEAAGQSWREVDAVSSVTHADAARPEAG